MIEPLNFNPSRKEIGELLVTSIVASAWSVFMGLQAARIAENGPKPGPSDLAALMRTALNVVTSTLPSDSKFRPWIARYMETVSTAPVSPAST